MKELESKNTLLYFIFSHTTAEQPCVVNDLKNYINVIEDITFSPVIMANYPIYVDINLSLSLVLPLCINS